MVDNKNRWENDFQTFLSSREQDVPRELKNNVTTWVHAELNPSAWKVFAKASIIHSMVGALTMLFCPQFGIKLTSSMGLMPYLMQFGEWACMFGCGVLFTGGSLLMISAILRTEEINVLRRHQILGLTSFVILSLSAFICLGADLIATMTLVWIIGAVIGGFAGLQIGWKIRSYAIARGRV